MSGEKTVRESGRWTKRAARQEKREERAARKEAKREARGAKKAAGGRRGKKKYVFLLLAAAAAAALFFSFRTARQSVPVSVICTQARTGDLEEIVSVSGKVESAQNMTVFSPVNAKIAEVLAEAGDAVKKGDLLVRFDTQELERALEKAQLSAVQAQSSYQSAMQDSEEKQNTYADASYGLDELKQMKENQEQYVQGLKYKREDDIAARKKDLYEWDKKLQEELNYQNRELAKALPGSEKEEEIQDIVENITAQRSDVQNEMNNLDSEENIKQMQRLIDAEEKKLSDMTEEIQRRESEQNSSEGGILNAYAKKEREASAQSAQLSVEESEQELALAEAGVVAPFDGIVTEVTAVQGAAAAEGAQLLTVAGNRDIQVSVELGRYDLEKVREGQAADIEIAGASYSGTVKKIDRMAQNNPQNAAVVYAQIAVENPDDGVFLGGEGKAEIHTASAQGAVLVPYEAVNTDRDGDFCYLVKEGVIYKQRIVTGISGDADVEVTEGISENDTIVISTDIALEEGMQVTPVMQ